MYHQGRIVMIFVGFFIKMKIANFIHFRNINW